MKQFKTLLFAAILFIFSATTAVLAPSFVSVPSALISTFNKKTGVPILLNTSFNENEPIVNTPANALDCFLRTKMDMLVIENYIVSR